MFAAHFAAGLALKGRARRAPLILLILAAFLLDGVWIVLGVLRIDQTNYDDWSHSFVMSTIWASLYSVPFWRLGRRVVCVLWLAVFSHFVLDFIVQGASACPPGLVSVGPLFVTHYRLLQLSICGVLLFVYVLDTSREPITWYRILATCAIVLALNGRFLLGV